MSDPNTTPPPYQGPGGQEQPPPSGPPTSPPQPGQYPAPPQPGQYAPPQPPGQFVQPGQFPNQPLQQYQPGYQQPAQPYAPWNPAEGWIPELGVKIAPAGVRIGAKAIDIAFYLILQIIGSIIIAAIWIGTGEVDGNSFGSSGVFAAETPGLLISFLAAFVLLAIDLAYNVACTARYGGTPGKLLLGLRVIRQDGRRIDLQGAFVRYTPILGLAVLAMVPIVSIIASLARLGLLVANLVMILTDERRRDVFDRVATTYVIATR